MVMPLLFIDTSSPPILANLIQTLLSFTYLHLFTATALIFITALYFSQKSNVVYLIDFSCYRPPNHFRLNFIEHFQWCNLFDTESIDFQVKICQRSGIGTESCIPTAIHKVPSDVSLYSTQQEIETVLFGIIEDILTKHNINPKNIDILVSNCSVSCPTPSITAMIINKFGFRSNVKSYNLSGMGCSAGIISISLVKDLLKVHKNSLALVLSMEAVTPNVYYGKTKSMLLTNTLFRMGGAAILLSNRKQDKSMAKYVLQHLVRTHMGSDDQSYRSVFQEPDGDGHVGVSLSKTLLNVAGGALRTNIAVLGPLVLPYSEQFHYGWSIIRRKIWAPARGKDIHMPDFKKAFEHFCIHTGGRAVIEVLVDKLGLCKEDGEASRMTLYRFGNTSSSSVWYELCYLEAKGRMKKGDRVWQIAFGSGFKCNSAVWKCVANLDSNVRNAWSDRIHLYPVDVSELAKP
ncbi:hypothetical protein HHK36_022925 [Tetracentron sinense]|uniref:3-ketoacyl-CoA synthase n=1 Tax=Tetracentron sinense TaxID=13715 RepID=A0A834YSU0_TETSI|nr:hypothetical protein HHK36_022925 [Tetracentron sinense]